VVMLLWTSWRSTKGRTTSDGPRVGLRRLHRVRAES
jgi:hypothetical protein